MANTINATILLLLGILVCLKGAPVTASTCLKLGYDDAYEIFTNILCLHGAAVSVIPTKSGITYTSPDVDSGTYQRMITQLHSEASIAYILVWRYNDLTKAYRAGMDYCYIQAINVKCNSSVSDAYHCFNQCLTLLSMTRNVTHQIRRLILGLGCEDVSRSGCNGFALNYTAAPEYRVRSMSEFAAKVANASTELYNGLAGYNKYRSDALEGSGTGTLTQSDFVPSIHFGEMCGSDEQPILLTTCE